MIVERLSPHTCYQCGLAWALFIFYDHLHYLGTYGLYVTGTIFHSFNMIIWQHRNKSCQVFHDIELNTWAAHLSRCPLLTKQLTSPRQIFQRIADCLFYFTTRFQLQHPFRMLSDARNIKFESTDLYNREIHNQDTSRIWLILSLITSLRKDQVLLSFHSTMLSVLVFIIRLESLWSQDGTFKHLLHPHTIKLKYC